MSSIPDGYKWNKLLGAYIRIFKEEPFGWCGSALTESGSPIVGVAGMTNRHAARERLIAAAIRKSKELQERSHEGP